MLSAARPYPATARLPYSDHPHQPLQQQQEQEREEEEPVAVGVGAGGGGGSSSSPAGIIKAAVAAAVPLLVMGDGGGEGGGIGSSGGGGGSRSLSPLIASLCEGCKVSQVGTMRCALPSSHPSLPASRVGGGVYLSMGMGRGNRSGWWWWMDGGVGGGWLLARGITHTHVTDPLTALAPTHSFTHPPSFQPHHFFRLFFLFGRCRRGARRCAAYRESTHVYTGEREGRVSSPLVHFL